jgi:hypothetical protein
VNNRYRSFFWPAVLILAGLIALLVNTGAISGDRLALLFDLWPVILIVIGLELIARRSLRGTTSDVAAALIVLVAVVGAVGYVVASPNPAGTHTSDASGALGSVDKASLEIDAGAATVTISGSADLGSELYRAHFDYSGPSPEVTFDAGSGAVRISQPNRGFFGSGKFTMTLQLNPSVPWGITVNTGASNNTISVANVRVSRLALNTGASREEITLGTPSGIVPLTIDGGALTVRLHASSQTQASIAVSGGAVNLSVPGRQIHAFGDATYQTPGFSGAADAYKVEINGGACNVSLDNSVASG